MLYCFPACTLTVTSGGLMVKFVLFLFVLAAPSWIAAGQQEPGANAAPSGEAKPKITRIRVGGATMAAQLKHKIQPKYPVDARKNLVQGTVRLHVIIGTDGKVLTTEVVSGDKLLTQSAVDAVRHWEYRPTMLNGQAVEVDTVVDVVYSFNR